MNTDSGEITDSRSRRPRLGGVSDGDDLHTDHRAPRRHPDRPGRAGLLLADGKIAGISGILGRSLLPASGDLGWRLAFLAGCRSAPGSRLA